MKISLTASESAFYQCWDELKQKRRQLKEDAELKSKQEREAVFAAYQTALLSTQKPSQHLPSKPQQVAQPAAVTVGGEGSKEEKSQKAPQAEEQPAPALSAKDRLVQAVKQGTAKEGPKPAPARKAPSAARHRLQGAPQHQTPSLLEDPQEVLNSTAVKPAAAPTPTYSRPPPSTAPTPTYSRPPPPGTPAYSRPPPPGAPTPTYSRPPPPGAPAPAYSRPPASNAAPAYSRPPPPGAPTPTYSRPPPSNAAPTPATPYSRPPPTGAPRPIYSRPPPAGAPTPAYSRPPPPFSAAAAPFRATPVTHVGATPTPHTHASAPSVTADGAEGNPPAAKRSRIDPEGSTD